MKKAQPIFLFSLILLLATSSCSSKSTSATEPATINDTNQETEASNSSDCLGDEISPIGQSIAEDFDTVDYQQVITWFCNGAEFEDILVALETEALTDSSAADMLQMLAEGLTWDEIWQSVGVTD